MLQARTATCIIQQHVNCCVYLQTGSGKSHTLLSYDENDLGIYKFAAQGLSQKLQVNDEDKDENEQRCLLVQVTEIYKDQVKYLMYNAI